MPDTPHIVATLSGIGAGVNTITKLHFMEDAPDHNTRLVLAAAIRDRFLGGFKTGCSSSMSWIAITISKVGDPNDSPTALAINEVGGGSGLLPMQVCIQWNLFSGVSAKRGRGRLFVPGLATATNAGGQLASTTKVSLDSVMTTMIGRWCENGSESFHFGVYSRKGLIINVCKTLTYNQIFSTLRTRKLGVGI